MGIKYYKRYAELVEEAQKIWRKHHRSEFPYRVESKYTFDSMSPYIRKQVIEALKQAIRSWQ